MFPGPVGEFTVPLKGIAEKVAIDSSMETNEIFGLELFAMASAVIAFGAQMGRKRMILFLDNDAAPGAMNRASCRARVILALTESFWRRVAQLAASRWVEWVASGANPADAQSRDRPPFRTPNVEGKLESLQAALQLFRASGTKKALTKKILRKQLQGNFCLRRGEKL